jgi:hypothetical protein
MVPETARSTGLKYRAKGRQKEEANRADFKRAKTGSEGVRLIFAGTHSV